jgi:hypothetical protein
MTLFKRLLLAICFLVSCISAFAQTSGGNFNEIKTVVGILSIDKVNHVGADGVTFQVKLNGREFDQLYGSHYTYYEDSENHGGTTRLIVEDFVGGFSDTPSVLLYDFRQKAPNILHVSDHLDVDGVRWTSSAVFLSANGKWYKFHKGRLLQSGVPKGLVDDSK